MPNEVTGKTVSVQKRVQKLAQKLAQKPAQKLVQITSNRTVPPGHQTTIALIDLPHSPKQQHQRLYERLEIVVPIVLVFGHHFNVAEHLCVVVNAQ